MWIRSGRLIYAGAAAVTVLTAALARARAATDAAVPLDDPSRPAANETRPAARKEAVQPVDGRGVKRQGGASPGSAAASPSFPSLPSVTVPPGCPASDTSSESSVGVATMSSARGDHEAGMVLFRQDRFIEAIDLWKSSYFKQCSAHKLLYNISVAYERLGHFRGALQYFEAYIQRAGSTLEPDESQAAKRRLRDLQLKTRIADLSFEAAHRFASLGAGPSNDTPERSRTNAINVSSRASRRSVPEGAARSWSNGSHAGPWPWVVVISGAAASVGGGVSWIVGAKIVADAETKCGSDRLCEHEEDVEQGNRGRRVRDAGVFSVAAGAGLLIGGFTWYLIDGRASPSSTSSPKRSVTLVPEANAHGGALRIEAGF